MSIKRITLALTTAALLALPPLAGGQPSHHSTRIVTGCYGHFTAQLRSGSLSDLALAGDLALTAKGGNVKGFLGSYDEITHKPIVLANVHGTIGAGRITLTFTTPSGKTFTGTGAATTHTLRNCSGLSGRLRGPGGASGYWAQVVIPGQSFHEDYCGQTPIGGGPGIHREYHGNVGIDGGYYDCSTGDFVIFV